MRRAKTFFCICSHLIEGASLRSPGARNFRPSVKALIAWLQSAISLRSSVIVAVVFLFMGCFVVFPSRSATFIFTIARKARLAEERIVSGCCKCLRV